MSDPIETERLLLRPPVPADAPAIARLVGDFEVSRWLAVVPHPYTLEDALEFIEHISGRWDRAITRDGELIGVVGITTSLGYWLGQPFWGCGYMSEAAGALVDAWFSFAPAAEHGSEGSTRPRAEAGRPAKGAAGRCPAAPPGGTVGEGTVQPARLASGYFTGNTASARVLTRLGFVPEGTETVHARALGRAVTSQRVVLSRARWEARHG